MRANRLYPGAKDGEWVKPVHQGFRHACCDCGLVHELEFRVVDGLVEFRATRHNRATGQLRRHRAHRVRMTK